MTKRTAAAATNPAGANDTPKAMKIAADVLLRSGGKSDPSKLINPFKPAQHPPGVVPPGMAMDEATTAQLAWAASSIGSIWYEGVAFLGYAYLSQLAQRPEYRVISEVIATEMTRKWIRLQASGDEDLSDKISQLETEMGRLKVQDIFREAAEQDGFFGRSHIYIDTGATDDPDELKTPIGDGYNDFSKTKIAPGSLKRLKSVEPVWVYPTNYNSNDPLSTNWYKPETWMVMGKTVHSSRLLTFVGREVPDLLKPAYSFGGLSMSQMAKPYVDNWLRTRQSVADLIYNFSTTVLKTNLAALLQMGNEEIFKRMQLFTNCKNNNGMMMLDEATEDLMNVAVPLGTLDALQAQSQEQMAAICRIPLVKLLGISPKGLNASSEGEIRSFYDWIHAYQEKLFTDNLKRILGFMQLSLWGQVDQNITFEYEPLWSLDEKSEAEKRKVDAETDVVLIDGGVISPEESRKRVGTDPDTPYHGLDIEDVPEPPVDEGLVGGEGDNDNRGEGGNGASKFTEAAE